MSIGFRSSGNILNNATIAGGLGVNQIPGDGGAGPSAFTIILSATGLVPGTGTIELLSPTTIVVSASGADLNGNLSCQTTWVNNGDDIHYSQIGGGIGSLPSGFWEQAQLIRGTLSLVSNTIGVDIQFGDADVLSFSTPLIDTPTNPTHSNDSWDGSQGKTTVAFKYSNNNAENPNAIAIKRNGVVVASIPWVNGIVNYTYDDIVFAPGTYIYSFAAYKYPDSIGPFSAPFSVTFGGPAKFEFIASGGMSFGGGAIFQFLVDPSGIYTLTIGKTHDTIYNNTKVGNTTFDMKIPDPFVDTAFVGE